jgi:hypothetical protein
VRNRFKFMSHGPEKLGGSCLPQSLPSQNPKISGSDENKPKQNKPNSNSYTLYTVPFSYCIIQIASNGRYYFSPTAYRGNRVCNSQRGSTTVAPQPHASLSDSGNQLKTRLCLQPNVKKSALNKSFSNLGQHSTLLKPSAIIFPMVVSSNYKRRSVDRVLLTVPQTTSAYPIP